MVIEAGVLHRTVAVQDRVRAEIDVRREKLFDQGAERVGLGQARDLIAELELVEDFLDVRREAIEIGLEIRLELLLAGAALRSRSVNGEVL